MTDLPGIQLVQAKKKDVPILLSILHTAFDEHQGRLDPPSGVHQETYETILHKLEKACAVLARVDGDLAGCVFYEQVETHVYLGRLAVLPQYRRQGVGGALINYVEQEALRLNLPRVQLGVRIALPYLKKYYEELGYRITDYGTHEGYNEPTFLIMEKEVA